MRRKPRISVDITEAVCARVNGGYYNRQRAAQILRQIAQNAPAFAGRVQGARATH